MATLVTTQGQSPSSATSASGLLAAVGDTVMLLVAGSDFASVRMGVVSGGSAVLTLEHSIDGGTNWFASGSGACLGKRLTAVATSPTVVAISSVSVTTGDGWELVVPSNCTHVRARCTVAGVATSITLTPLQSAVPGTSVTGVLFDVSGAGVLDTGIIDVSGWSSASFNLTASAASLLSNFTIKAIDDAGAAAGADIFSVPLSLGGVVYRVLAGVGMPPFALTLLAATGSVALTACVGRLPKRIQVVSLALATNRMRGEVGR